MAIDKYLKRMARFVSTQENRSWFLRGGNSINAGIAGPLSFHYWHGTVDTDVGGRVVVACLLLLKVLC